MRETWCLECGNRLRGASAGCLSCGPSLAAPVPAPHRGTLLLTLAALSYVICCGFGAAAWWMARHDLIEIDAGRMDPSGSAQTRAALVLAVANMILHVLVGLAILIVTSALLIREYYR
ncbi:MAG: hypothetical protein EHM42_15320 [Planctomycetaceae bacterium]|nr:MAG: hypothetical protein EHM42_15320 [Planctomycetaceae bacterium]